MEVEISCYKVAGETGSVLCRFALWDCLGAIRLFYWLFYMKSRRELGQSPPAKTIPRCNPPCRPLGETDAISHKSEPGNMANAVFFTRFILYTYVSLTLAISASATYFRSPFVVMTILNEAPLGVFGIRDIRGKNY